jgi:hypothetical protein
MSPSKKLDLKLKLRKDHKLSPIHSGTFPKNLFPPRLRFTIRPYFPKKKEVPLQNDFDSITTHLVNSKYCIELGKLPDILLIAKSNTDDNFKSSH